MGYIGDEHQCDSVCPTATCGGPADFIKSECGECAQCTMRGAAWFAVTCHESCGATDAECLAGCAGVVEKHLRSGECSVPAHARE